jgi:hypothetical protein
MRLSSRLGTRVIIGGIGPGWLRLSITSTDGHRVAVRIARGRPSDLDWDAVVRGPAARPRRWTVGGATPLEAVAAFVGLFELALGEPTAVDHNQPAPTSPAAARTDAALAAGVWLVRPRGGTLAIEHVRRPTGGTTMWLQAHHTHRGRPYPAELAFVLSRASSGRRLLEVRPPDRPASLRLSGPAGSTFVELVVMAFAVLEHRVAPLLESL